HGPGQCGIGPGRIAPDLFHQAGIRLAGIRGNGRRRRRVRQSQRLFFYLSYFLPYRLPRQRR
ncbi:MAG: hypothetical protein ABIY63_20980, partial [Fibrobacteria bacterium]